MQAAEILECPDMGWARKRYSKERVDEAGTILINDEAPLGDKERAEEVINNWRSCHAFPLNTFQVGLRRLSKRVDRRGLVAQRIKRLSSIEDKLKRITRLSLSEIQDIGGCRAVVSTIAQVDRLVKAYEQSHIKHKLVNKDDYIRNPKKSGYRGVHLIYTYRSDRTKNYNGLKIEVQLRSKLQHAWATAVETVGTFTRQALKSSRGEADWLRFFQLMGTAIAIREESPPCPHTPTNALILRKELKLYATKLDIESRLRTYGEALKTSASPGAKRAHYFLLELNPTAERMKITGFKSSELSKASKEYFAAERAIADIGADAVLVSVESLTSLRRAYPNYFLDTKVFLQAVREAIEENYLA